MEVEAPAGVEATLFHQPDRHRYVVSLVNFQKELPNLPIDGIKVTVRTAERCKGVRQLAKDLEIRFQKGEGAISFHAPRLETLAMFSIEVG